MITWKAKDVMPAMRSLGSVSRDWLQQVGITSRDELTAADAVTAFLMVRQAGLAPSL